MLDGEESGSISLSSDESSIEEEDFAVMSSKIKSKFTIKARQTCYLLQMQKSALQKMFIEFPEIFTKMLADEMQMCIHAMKQKAKLIEFLEYAEKENLNTSTLDFKLKNVAELLDKNDSISQQEQVSEY